MNSEGPMKGVFFSNDTSDSNQVRRIRSLADCGLELVLFLMNRRNLINPIGSDVVERFLYYTKDGQHFKRLLKIAASMYKIWDCRKDFVGAHFLIGRNIDMLFLVVFSYLLFCKKDSVVIYECLDIHYDLTRPGIRSSILRFIERRLLSFVDVIITSSPEYAKNYFIPVQKFSKEIYLLENRIYFGKSQRPERPSPAPRPPNARFTVGLIGAIKCPVSFDLFLELARKFPNEIEVHIHGYFTPRITNASEIDGLANVKIFGRYKYPDDLQGIYASLDAVWVADLWRRGANSDWALANRLYEAGYFGCPSLSVRGLATATFIEEKGVGFVADNSEPATVASLLLRLRADGTADVRRKILMRDWRDFVQTTEDVARLISLIEQTYRRKSAGISAQLHGGRGGGPFHPA